MRKYLPSMKPRTHPRIAIFPVVNAFAVRVAALVVAHVLVAIGSNENALAVLSTFLEVAYVRFFALPLDSDLKLSHGLDREVAMFIQVLLALRNQADRGSHCRRWLHVPPVVG